MPTLHLQVCAGFANRIRALVSGICVAEDLNMALVIHWFPKSPECACRFSSLVDPESLPKTVKVVLEDIYQAKTVNNAEEWKQVARNWDGVSDLEVKSHGMFYTNENYNTHLRRLKPSPQVKEFLGRRTASVPWNIAVGVHIRRTDNKKSIEGSPLENFLQRMRDTPDLFYIVATDDDAVRKQIQTEFADRCLFVAMTLSRKSEEGMIHGVADFFALSSCKELWGSYWSSFSEISARYGDIPLTII